MDYESRLTALQDGVNAAKTPKRKVWCQTILNNIVKYIQASAGDDEKFRAALWGDYLAWCAWYFTGEKLPIFLTRKQYQMYVNLFKYSSNIWMYQRRAGKCGKFDTKVQMLTGETKELQHVNVGDKVISIDEHGNAVPDIVTDKWDTGTKECFNMTLDGNFHIESTAEHKYMTHRGWLPLSEITTDDYVAVPTKLPTQTNGTLQPDEARIIAAWIAEGTKKAESYRWTNGNPEIVQTISDSAKALGWKQTTSVSKYLYGIIRDDNRQSPINWLHEKGLKDCTTWGAYVPDCVFQSSNESVAAFLNIYAGCDGYVDESRGMAGFCSRSLRLCEDIRSLLLRFGINSSIRYHNITYKGEVNPTYETQVYGAENFVRFAQQIGAAGKMDKVNAALALIQDRTYQQTRFSKIPTETWSSEINYADLNKAGANGKSTAAYYLMSAKKYSTTQKNKAQHINKFAKNEKLKHLLGKDVAWMKVKSIAPSGEHQTYDIEVGKNHNFIANNIVTHNSLGTAVLTLYYAMTHPNSKILCFAPTEDQLVLMQEARRVFADESASELYTQFLGERVIKGSGEVDDESLNKLGSKFNQREIRFLNGSQIQAVTLNVLRGGASRRGFSANIIIVDEFQDVERFIREEIIEPIIMDAFSDEKRLVYIGTPHTKVDKKLDLFWDESVKSPSEGTLHSQCWEAVEEGIRLPESMSKRFRKLSIPCKWVLEHGVCPVYLPDMFESVSGKTVERDEKGRGVVACGEICMTNPTFVQEDMAMFPRDYGLGIPPDWITAAGHSYVFYTEADLPLPPGTHVVMSIDWGDVRADTQICIWLVENYDNGPLKQTRLRLIHEVVVNDPQEVGIKNPSAEIVKRLCAKWRPEKIYVDVTGKKEQITELISGNAPIGRHLFYTNDGAAKNNVVGMWFSGPTKASMFDNMKEQLRLNRIIVPDSDIVFWDKFFNELINLKPKEATQTRPYVLWGETMHLTDAVAMAALHLQEAVNDPASMSIAMTAFENVGRYRDDDDEDGDSLIWMN